jgi:hypothetical protein
MMDRLAEIEQRSGWECGSTQAYQGTQWPIAEVKRLRGQERGWSRQLPPRLAGAPA